MRSRSDLVHTGQVTPNVDRTFPLDDAAQAMELLAAGHVRGKIAIAVGPGCGGAGTARHGTTAGTP